MDDRVRLFLSALAGAGLFGLLGLVFGAASGAALRAGGRAAGGVLGLAAARALVRARGRELSDVATGAVVGGVDGVTFLGGAGTVFGLVYGWVGPAQREVLLNLAMGVGVLALGAVLFSALAAGLIRAGVWGIGAVFVAAMAGSAVGARLAGLPGLLYGAVCGLGAGALLGVLRAGARPPSDEDRPDEPG